MSQTITPKRVQALNALIKQDIHHVTQLILLMETEKTFLEQRQHDDLLESSQQKNTLLNTLQSSERQRKSILNDMGLEMSAAGMESLIKRIPKTWQTQLTSAWQQLKERLNECQRLNQVNGRIIHHNKHTLNRILDVLHGQTDGAVYQASGEAKNVSNQRSLAYA